MTQNLSIPAGVCLLMAKRKWMPFQTRLMLTMLAIVVGVMVALTMATERKIKDTYKAQFLHQKESIVEDLETSRADRSREFLDLSSRFAAHPHVIGLLRGENRREDAIRFWSDYTEAVLALASTPKDRWPGNRSRSERSNADFISRFSKLAIVDLQLRFERIEPPATERTPGRKGPQRRAPSGNPRLQEVMTPLLTEGKQHTLFIPLPSFSGPPQVQEMVSTPVIDPKSGEILGLLLRGSAADADTRRLFQGKEILTGIFLEGELYSRAEDEDFLALSPEIVSTAIADAPGERKQQFDADLNGLPYRFHVDRLTEEEVRPTAYRVIAFPLHQMEADLKELRIRGSGIGLGVLLIGWLASYLLARNLAIPLRELARGTQAIREGALDHRVEVRSRDEIGHLAESFNEMAEELKQKALFRELLGKVSDESVAQALVSGSLDLELGGEMKEVSVLFCDIRGFTDLTQDMHPSEVIEFLNEHMSVMTDIVRRHCGVVDKFVGDEIMAVFGGLKSYGNDAAHAVSCALSMIEERDRLNHLRRETGDDPPIEIGIGIATGGVIAGCMGSTDRLNYTVLGARVNLAARLCGQAGRMEAVVDEVTAAATDSSIGKELIPDLQLKGFRETVPAYRIHRVEEDSFSTDPGTSKPVQAEPGQTAGESRASGLRRPQTASVSGRNTES